jgi:GNAT acetyltransferase-like protein
MRIYDNPQFSSLPDELHRLFAAEGSTSFFDRPGWYETLSQYGLEPGARLRVYAISGAALVCDVREAGEERQIRGGCSIYACDQSIVLADGLADPTHEARQLAFELARHNASTDHVLLPGLDPSDPRFAAMLEGLWDAGFVARPYFGWGSWYEPVEARDFEAYRAARPSALKNTWRRKLGALEKSVPFAFHMFDGDLNAFVAEYEAVYRRSWKRPEPFPDFIPALIRAVHREGALRGGILVADGKPIAVQFWIVWRGCATIYKLAYDQDWSKFSPGTLLTMRMIEQVLGCDRPRELSFGRGDDGYKKLWMSERRERWGIEAANPRTPRGLVRSLRIRAAEMRDRVLRGSGARAISHSRTTGNVQNPLE